MQRSEVFAVSLPALPHTPRLQRVAAEVSSRWLLASRTSSPANTHIQAGRCERSAGIMVPDRNEKKNNLPLSLGVRIRQPTTITEVKLTRCRDLRCSPSHFPHCHTRPDFRESRPKSVADGCLLPGLLRRQTHTHRQADVRGPLASGSLIEL